MGHNDRADYNKSASANRQRGVRKVLDLKRVGKYERGHSSFWKSRRKYRLQTLKAEGRRAFVKLHLKVAGTPGRIKMKSYGVDVSVK